MRPLISKTMVHYLLKGERNLNIGKAKIIGKMTSTDPIIWIDPSRVFERQSAWRATFKNEKK